MTRIKLMLVFFLFGTCCVHAQLADLLRQDVFIKGRLFFAIDEYNSFISSRLASINGVRFGLSYNEKSKIGIGFYALNTAKSPIRQRLLSGKDSVTATLAFNYLSLGVEYTFYQKYPWQLSIPAQIGFGSSYYLYNNRKYKEAAVLLYEPAIMGHYKILKWFGVGFGLGYRLMIVPNTRIDKSFNSPIYLLRLRIFPEEIYYFFFPKKNGEDIK